MTMLTSNFDKTVVSISKNIKLLAMAQYNTFEKEFPLFIKKESTDLQIEKEMGYEGFGAAPEKAESDTAAQTRIYEGYVESTQQKSYVYEVSMSWENRRFANANVKFTAMLGSFLARSGMLRYEYLTANVQNNGFVAGAYATGDGQAYFSAAHLWKSGGTYDNLLANAAMSTTTVENMLIEVANAKMEAGVPAAFKVKDVMIPYALILKLPEILKSKLDPDNANNTYNAIQDFNLNKKLNHYYSSATAWFVDTDQPSRTMYEASPMKLDDYLKDSTNDLVNRLWCSVGAGVHHMARSFGNVGA